MILEILLFLLIVAGGVFYIACGLCTLKFPDSHHTVSNNEPVSILIPVCGVDSAALGNWTSFCTQDYPEYEVLFGVKDNDDAAIPILRDIVARFPEKARLFVDLPPKGINYQISNLMYLLDNAKYDLIILADSDIEVTPDYLKTLTIPFSDPNIGVVTCGYADHQPKFIGAALASLGRCVDFLPSVLVARFLDKGMTFALGPTIAIRKTVVNKFGGLQQVVNRIGSDYNIGKMATEAGYKVELSQYILNNDCGGDSPWDVFKRELRWARTIRMNRGKDYYGLLFTYGTVYSLFLLLISGFSPYAIYLSAVVLNLRLIQASVAIYRFGCPHLTLWLWLLPLRDAMSFLIWLWGAFGNKVYWRGRILEIGDRGQLSEARD
ncbi:MAG: hypothetical protein N5P05_000126 [Chroococcopsis gigantea SAG 12.99]|jgi:ceramide glucosyltransferase|nr:glycosyltransferase [Chlorogloea purpurea SAG 13.99]MDV2998520.1 hypothetical protein [Chroococcopsis gigantea SAG 12.99]